MAKLIDKLQRLMNAATTAGEALEQNLLTDLATVRGSLKQLRKTQRTKTRKKGRRLSAATRRKMSIAQRARWKGRK